MSESQVQFMRDASHPGEDARLSRFAERLSDIPELISLVVTGHLLLEEILTNAIAEAVPHGEFIRDARLNFATKVDLGRAISWDQHQNEAWTLIVALNELRNALAHKLDSPALNAKLRRLRATMVPLDSETASSTDEAVVRAVIAHCAGFLLECLSEAYELRRLLTFEVKELLALDGRADA
jgi:hypothetical protein